ncbi:high-potential iron-sulfur protein [bacterium]|jgi:hypothetical protein|nr:high-potential iron-sulfur protein [bacterium]
MNKTPSDRRRFLGQLISFAALLSTPQLFLAAFANAAGANKEKKSAAPGKGKVIPLPAGKVAVPETDPVANALGYHADASKTDFAKYPQRKLPANKNQFCDGCALYVKANEGWGQCTMIQAGLVAAKGWCGSWQKKS